MSNTERLSQPFEVGAKHVVGFDLGGGQRSLRKLLACTPYHRHRRLITASKRMASSSELYIENPTRTSPPAGTCSTSTGRGA